MDRLSAWTPMDTGLSGLFSFQKNPPNTKVLLIGVTRD